MGLCVIDGCPVEVSGKHMICGGCWSNVPVEFRRYVEKKFKAGGVTVGQIFEEISAKLQEIRDRGDWRSYVHPRAKRAS